MQEERAEENQYVDKYSDHDDSEDETVHIDKIEEKLKYLSKSDN